MANTTPGTDTSIEALLEERAQYEQWLTKLDAAANNAPASVRTKVRGDYEARLRGVIEQLRGHAVTHPIEQDEEHRPLLRDRGDDRGEHVLYSEQGFARLGVRCPLRQQRGEALLLARSSRISRGYELAQRRLEPGLPGTVAQG